ncbi:MAG: PSD1 and planctomycete cytochrome C domain-containing protein [Planctomycetia bacterium]
MGCSILRLLAALRTASVRRPLLACLIAWPIVAAAEAPLDFNRDIRPILSENCFYCHGQDGNKREADLRLDDRAAAVAAGAIVPGDPGASVALERIHSTDADVIMPPPYSNRRLSAAQKQLLDRWIKEGAAYAPHWAFVPPVRPEPPQVTKPGWQEGWARNDIDRFVLAKLETAGLRPSPEADRATLIRRLHADLVGLPPTPEEVDAFVADPAPAAYDKLVDRLLSSPHYGERMALSWLDAARYADSNGFQQDGDTWQWIWRDWVVRAFNADMPFDRFSTEQLAGDLLPDATTDQRVASGFNRNHLLNGEGGAIAEEQRFNNLFDRVDTTSTTWLGLTMACAQCHDHKYDPMTQADYYSLLDAFNRVSESGTPTRFSARIRVAPPVVELPTEENKARLAELEAAMKTHEAEALPVLDAAYAAWKSGLFSDGEPADGEGLSRGLTPLLRKPEQDRTDAEKASIEKQLRSHFDAQVKPGIIKGLPQVVKYDAAKKAFEEYKGDQIPRVMVMADDKPRETKILDRGDYLSPKGEKIAFAPPAFLPPLPEAAPANRLGLARWLFLPEHPLTARVQVNRMWQHFFGTGLVKTSEDMGVQSEYPVHLPLLDWLAVEFRERGWSQKQMHRLLVTSGTYRQASRVTAEHLAKDPENRLFARGARFRMPSMVLRDVALAASGLLDPRLGGQPVYPYQPDEIWEALAITKERDFTYPASHGADLYRRSLYTFWRRTVNPANMFDMANRQTCNVRASRTCTPLHALTTLNDPTWVESSRVLAERAMQATPDTDGRLAFAFRRVLGRRPTDYDLTALRRMHERQREAYRADAEAAGRLLGVGEHKRDETLDASEHAALTAVCLGIFNLDEALTRE